jgi:hypothetical protein
MQSGAAGETVMTSDAGKRPSFIAYTVRDYTKSTGEPDASWTRIGVAFAHGDGWGYDLVLDALPVNGRVVLRSNHHNQLDYEPGPAGPKLRAKP